MEELKPLFNKRDRRYAKASLKIFELIGTTLDCVTIFLTDNNETVSQGIVSWEEVSFMDDMVIVIGMVQFDLGKTINILGRELVVTEENVHELQHMIHMAVPINLVENSDEQEIMEYLLKSDGHSIGEVETSDIELSPTTPSDQDFDLSKLSAEQLASLKLAPPKSGH